MKEKYKRLGAEAICCNEKDSYILWGTVIWKADYIEKKAIPFYFCEYDADSKSYKYSLIEAGNGKFYFVPYGRNTPIAVTDSAGTVIDEIPINIENRIMKYELGTVFRYSVRIENKIYLLGYNSPIILCLDTDTHVSSIIDDWVEYINEDEEIYDYDGYFYRGHVLKNNKLYLPMGRQKSLLEIDITNNSTRVINLDIEAQGVGGITEYDENTFLLVGRGKNSASVMVYDVQTEKIIAQKHADPINDIVWEAFCPPVVHGKDIYLIPFMSLEFDYAYKYDIVKNEIEIDENLSKLIHPQIYNNTNLHMIYQAGALAKIDDDTIRFCRGEDLKWFEYNLKTKEYNEYFIEMDISEDEYKKLYSNWMISYAYTETSISESIFPLEGFLQLVKDYEV